MESIKDQAVKISEGYYKPDQLVSLLVLIASQLDIDTISEIARKEGKTPRGILISNKYKKINIGKQKFAIIGVAEDTFPF